MPNIPTVKKLPEGPRDPELGSESWLGGKAPQPVPQGEEPWRDGRSDDGEQDSDDALASSDD